MNPAACAKRERRLRAVARQIIRRGFTSQEVASALARTALEYAERNIGDAARVLGLSTGDVEALTKQAAVAIQMGDAAATNEWQSDHGALPQWSNSEAEA